ncbi:MAG: CRTAC1 family protein [bacterium]|nr:CRTAC1 family protein [bacterium]
MTRCTSIWARVGIAVVAALALVGPCAEESAPQVRPIFVDATAQSGLAGYDNVCGDEPGSKGWLHEGMGAGAAWLDYDGDGNLDLYVANGSTHDRKPGEGEPNRLYRGDGKGKFVDVTDKAGVGHRGWGYGVAVGDYDNDGNPDIFVTNLGRDVLYRNRGDGTFEDVTTKAGVGHHDSYSTSAAFFDMDNDGDLDLYVAAYMEDGPGKTPRRGTPEALEASCVYKSLPVYCGPLGRVPLQDVLYRNDGDGTFTDATKAAGVWLARPRYALGVVTADYDNDGDQDLYVANDSVANSLWRNRGDGTFEDVGVKTLSALNTDGKPQAGMGTDFGDYTGDGWVDIVVTNFAHDTNTVYRNLGGRFFVDDSGPAGLSVTYLALSWGTAFYDFDHDGDMDLFIANGHVYPQVDGADLGTRFRQRNHLFVRDGKRFHEAAESCGAGMAVERSFRGAAFGDPDNDGDVDVLLTSLDEGMLLLRNETPDPGNSLQVQLIGADANRDAIGARVTVRDGESSWHRQRKGGGSYLSGFDPRLHFGLGKKSPRRIEIAWPGGETEVLTDVPPNSRITVRQGKGIVKTEP